MLSVTEYARQLDAALDLVGNDLGALDRLNAALALMPDFDEPEFEPTPEDWAEYDEYLDRLDAEREYPPAESPRWTAWTQWLRTPTPVPDDTPELIAF